VATILCDLDGTLLRRLPGEDPTPKRVAMNAALAEVSGLAGVDYRQGIADGLTDWQIAERALQRLRPGARLDGPAWQRVTACAEARFTPPPPQTPPAYAALPGVPATLHALRAAGHRLGIATGNLAVFLGFKLAQAGIDRDLFTGPVAGGDHGRERWQILRAAVARRETGQDPAAASAVRSPAAGRSTTDPADDPRVVIVLGDTGHDRDAAAAVGLPFLGVGTTGLAAGGVVPRPGSPAAWLADLADACAVVAQVADLARAG
jgi:phosphoglycolate phosphatase-like HAD superfamily hydrolase